MVGSPQMEGGSGLARPVPNGPGVIGRFASERFASHRTHGITEPAPLSRRFRAVMSLNGGTEAGGSPLWRERLTTQSSSEVALSWEQAVTGRLLGANSAGYRQIFMAGL